MKLLLIPIVLALTILAAAPVAAQDACTQADPCPWSADLGPGGFDDNALGGTFFNGTAGDWHQFDFFNADEQAHTVTVDGYGLAWTIQPLDTLTSEPFELSMTGRFIVRDSPTGDAAQMNVGMEDVVDEENEQDEDGGEADNGAPAPPAVWAVVGLLGLAALARRRTT